MLMVPVLNGTGTDYFNQTPLGCLVTLGSFAASTGYYRRF
jgi:hypothetical protein